MTETVGLADATVLKSANTFCVALGDGRLPLSGEHPLGLYHDDCRFLRCHELTVNGRQPRLSSGTDAAGDAAVFELTDPDLRLERWLLPDGMLERITLTSAATEEVDLELRLDADFRPMLEVRGLVPISVREVRMSASGHTLRFEATGVDGRRRSTTVSCGAALAEADGRLSARLRSGSMLEVRYRLREEGRGPLPPANSRPGVPRLEVDDELSNRLLQRSLQDLRVLASMLDGRRYYAAGIPWYSTLFGRDSIIAGLQTLAFDSETAADTLRLLAARLGTSRDDDREEEPGKVLHELRQGELAETDATPLTRYYGSVDATPLFLCLLAEHADWAGSLELFRELRTDVERAIAWLDSFAGGLLTYRSRASGGLRNQGWKDSWDGVPDEHGRPLRPPIALVEAQAYAAAAKRRLARLYRLDGDERRAAELRAGGERHAAALERFWLSERGFYALALDGDDRPSGVLASNQGHLLWADVLSRERAGAVVAALLSDDAYSGWGVRTLAASERSFDPLGYHTGSVWPHDNAFLAVGLRRFGFDDAFVRLFEAMLDAAAGFPDGRLPELFAGSARVDDVNPAPYAVACRPQAWAAGTLPWLLMAGLGLAPDGLHGVLRIRRPCLPRRIGRVALKGVRVGRARADLVFERVNGEVALAGHQVDGELEVVVD